MKRKFNDCALVKYCENDLQYISHPQFNNELIGLENIFLTYMAQIFRVQILYFFIENILVSSYIELFSIKSQLK